MEGFGPEKRNYWLIALIIFDLLLILCINSTPPKTLASCSPAEHTVDVPNRE